MKVPVSFLSLFLMLLFGNVNSFAESGFRNQRQASSLCTNGSVMVDNCYTGYNLFYFTKLTFPEENRILLFEEVEDEDSNEVSFKKVRSADGLVTIFYDQFYFDIHHHFAKASPFLWRNTSHRYILQRTLRI